MSPKSIHVKVVGTQITYVIEIRPTVKAKDVLAAIDCDGYFLRTADGHRFPRGQNIYYCVCDQQDLQAVPIVPLSHHDQVKPRLFRESEEM